MKPASSMPNSKVVMATITAIRRSRQTWHGGPWEVDMEANGLTSTDWLTERQVSDLLLLNEVKQPRSLKGKMCLKRVESNAVLVSGRGFYAGPLPKAMQCK